MCVYDCLLHQRFEKLIEFGCSRQGLHATQDTEVLHTASGSPSRVSILLKSNVDDKWFRGCVVVVETNKQPSNKLTSCFCP